MRQLASFMHDTSTPTASTSLTLFFFNDTPTTEIYTLSLHDALPISSLPPRRQRRASANHSRASAPCGAQAQRCARRSEEHTSELQSPDHLVCRLLLEKKKVAPMPLTTVIIFGVSEVPLPLQPTLAPH